MKDLRQFVNVYLARQKWTHARAWLSEFLGG